VKILSEFELQLGLSSGISVLVGLKVLVEVRVKLRVAVFVLVAVAVLVGVFVVETVAVDTLGRGFVLPLAATSILNPIDTR
jgi:4-amino-4-deoxy-L-arabinose transferase-like glycosyltransferase